VSDPQNPLVFPPPAGMSPPELEPPVPPAPVTGENPPWGWMEIVGIVAVTIVSVFFGLLAVIAVAHKYLYPEESLMEVAQQHPILLVAAQALAYLLVVGFMVFVVKKTSALPFAQGIKWNWPDNAWVYLVGGVALSLGLQLLGHFLPIPRELPMDKFFRTPLEAWGLAIFGMLCAPFVEELFFRGFLYPVLARWFGVGASIIITAIGFGLVHASQLGRAWGPVLIIFLVGVTLTTIRAKTKSVAAGWLVHTAYNSTIFGLMFIATSGFRHMERLTQ
jgi:CAAX protease family protein